MFDFTTIITFESNGVDIEKIVFVEYEFSGGYEAPSHDSEGCEPDLEFEIFDDETGKVLDGFIVDQVEDSIFDKITAHHEKVCESDAADDYYT